MGGHGARAVRSGHHPGRLVAGALERAAQPQEAPALEQVTPLGVERDLVADGLAVGRSMCAGSSSYPNAPNMATAARKSIGARRPVWWFGIADTCAAMDESG